MLRRRWKLRKSLSRPDPVTCGSLAHGSGEATVGRGGGVTGFGRRERERYGWRLITRSAKASTYGWKAIGDFSALQDSGFFLLAEFCQHAEILECGGITLNLASGGDLLEQATHDFS